MHVLEFLYSASQISGADKNKNIVDLIRAEYTNDIDKLMRILFDNEIVFGVKKVEPVATGRLDPFLDFTEVFKLLDNLSNETYESNAIRDSDIARVLSMYNYLEQELIINIIKKKPRLGFTQKLLNTVITTMGYEPIEQFKCMKASKLKTEEEYKTYLSTLTMVETKYDGERLIAFVDIKNEKVEYKTREGLVSKMSNLAIDYELIMFAKEYYNVWYGGKGPSVIVFDGEKYAGDFIKTMNSKKSGADSSSVMYRIFFVMNEKEWQEEKCKTTLEDFRNSAIGIMTSDYESIQITEATITHSYNEAYEVYKNILDAGGEGCMLKRCTSTYEWKRSRQWIKWVPKINVDMMIINILPGDAGSKYEMSCGKVESVGRDETGDEFRSFIGSGFTDDERQDMFINPDNYIGLLHEVEARSYSVDSKTEIKSLRFGTHKKFRTDK